MTKIDIFGTWRTMLEEDMPTDYSDLDFLKEEMEADVYTQLVIDIFLPKLRSWMRYGFYF